MLYFPEDIVSLVREYLNSTENIFLQMTNSRYSKITNDMYLSELSSVGQLIWAKRYYKIWNVKLSHAIAKNGSIELMDFIRDQDKPCPYNVQTCAIAALYGHLELLIWLRTPRYGRHSCKMDYKVRENAALNGHLHILKWAYK